MLFLNLTQALETYHARFVSNDLRKYIKLVDVFLRKSYKLTDDDGFDGHILSYRQVLIAQNEEGMRSITLKSRLGYLFWPDLKLYSSIWIIKWMNLFKR